MALRDGSGSPGRRLVKVDTTYTQPLSSHSASSHMDQVTTMMTRFSRQAGTPTQWAAAAT